MNRRCDGIMRRDALRIGGLSALGISLFSGLQPSPALAAKAKAKACILLWLDGGPSHLETFDVKPEAPAEVRGPFKPIPTSVSGTYISEVLPNTAKITDKIAIIRSMTSPLGEHGLANQYLLSGYKPTPVLDYPSYGSMVAKFRSGQQDLPAYVAIPDAREPDGPGYLGSEFSPFAIGGDPAKKDFRVRDLDFYPGINASRLQRRRKMLAQLEQFQRATETTFQAEGEVSDPRFEQAYRMVTSAQAKQAFDLSQEKEALRGQYGLGFFGQSCLMARRLVESGVSFVTVNYEGWDTHENLLLRLKEGYTGAKVGVGLVPTFDHGFAALIGDLADRGMLESTLVLAMGEFGRTPKLNTRGGRDHWPRVFSVVMAGGGVSPGIVVGASDAIGESPLDRPITPADLAYTIYHLLGIDPALEIHTADGRPVQVNQGGELVKELFA
jgi:Protein of unknown function (DUF1501)